MKRSLMTVLGSAALLAIVSPAARADAFLSLQNGAVVLTCNNSTAGGVAACTAAGFTTVLGGNTISFSGIIGGYAATDITLTGNSPGTAGLAFASDTKTAIQNISAGATALIVSFAENNFALPAGSPLQLSASQSATFTAAAVGSSQAFSGFGNFANTLTPGAGVSSITPMCVNPAAAPPVNACASAGPSVLFTTVGAFSLSGVQTVALNQGGIANFTSTVGATGTVTPEPGSLILLATGLIGIVGGRRVFRRKA